MIPEGRDITDRKTAVDVCSYIRGIIEYHMPKALEKSSTLEIKNLPETIFCNINRSKFSRVIDNIVSNAIKFTNINGNIMINIEAGRECALLKIKDDGIGIPDIIKENIFKPFTSSGRKGTNNEESTGLGLSICKKIIELHSGEIWFESDQKKGSTFFVSLPLDK